MKRPSRSLLAAISLAALLVPEHALAAALSGDCGAPPAGALCPNGPWFEFASLQVDVVQGPANSHYEITLGAGRDLRVKIDEKNPQYAGRAEALLIDGATLASLSDRSLPIEGQDLFNDPLLAAQEVAALLQIALPRGPRSVSKATPVRATGARILTARTPSMSSYYGPPWTVDGRITPLGKGDYAFDLTLRFRIALPDGTVTPREHMHRYSGRVSYPPKRPRVPDSMDLTGWKIDLPPGSFQGTTLGDVRRALGIAPPR